MESDRERESENLHKYASEEMYRVGHLSSLNLVQSILKSSITFISSVLYTAQNPTDNQNKTYFRMRFCYGFIY